MFNKVTKYFTGVMTVTGTVIGGKCGLDLGYSYTKNDAKIFDSVFINTMSTCYGMILGGITGALWCISIPVLIHKLKK